MTNLLKICNFAAWFNGSSVDYNVRGPRFQSGVKEIFFRIKFLLANDADNNNKVACCTLIIMIMIFYIVNCDDEQLWIRKLQGFGVVNIFARQGRENIWNSRMQQPHLLFEILL